MMKQDSKIIRYNTVKGTFTKEKWVGYVVLLIKPLADNDTSIPSSAFYPSCTTWHVSRAWTSDAHMADLEGSSWLRPENFWCTPQIATPGYAKTRNQ